MSPALIIAAAWLVGIPAAVIAICALGEILYRRRLAREEERDYQRLATWIAMDEASRVSSAKGWEL